MKMLRPGLTLAVTALTVGMATYSAPTLAQSELWAAARERLAALRAGKVPKTEPVHAQGAVEQWGDAVPMPARGHATEGHAAAATSPATRAGTPAAARPVREETRREQDADERQLDDREDDARPERTAPRAQPRGGRAAAVAQKAARPAARGGASAEDRVYRLRVGAEAPTTRASCTNVARAWEGAAALAQRGEEQRAYDAYLRLLGSCTEEKELVGTAFQAQRNLSAEMLSELMVEPLLESPRLQTALFNLRVQRMYTASKARDTKPALALARELREQLLDARDAGALEVAGWLEQRARSPKAAEPLFRAALKANRDAQGAREGLVFALLAQGKVDSAAREVERLDSAGADEIRAEVSLAQARAALEQDQPAETLKLLAKAERLGANMDDGALETRAWALKRTGQAARAARLFAELVAAQPDNAALATGLVDALAAARDEPALVRLAGGTGVTARASKEALARRLEEQGRRSEAARMRGGVLEGEGPAATVAMGVRAKSGEPGGGRLTEVALPALRADGRIGSRARLQAEVTGLRLDDGVHESHGSEARARVVATWENAEVTVGGGSSRTEGATKLTFEARGRVYTDKGHVEGGVKREPVRDSVRSYSGVDVEVPVAGGGTKVTRAGRVTDTYAYIGGATLLDHANRYNLAWQVGGGSVSGLNSPNNGYYRSAVAVMQDVQDARFSWLSVGPYAAFQAYERDENRFDGTHGGYFSPKSDLSLGMRLDALTLEGGKSLAKADAKVAYVSRGLYYGNDSGAAVEVGLEGAWLLGGHLILGAGVGLRTSPGYSDVAFRAGLTVPFERRTRLFSRDLALFRAQQ